jgi:hypothetical protein
MGAKGGREPQSSSPSLKFEKKSKIGEEGMYNILKRKIKIVLGNVSCIPNILRDQ